MADARATGLIDELRVQDEAWQRRPFVRRLYREWYRLVVAQFSPLEGPTVELGSGISRFKEHHPATVATDVEPTPWVSTVASAEDLPYDDGSVANLVLFDVFHHLPNPTIFLDEAVRALKPGGRVVVLDPYCSPVSYWAYRHFHHERTDLDADPFTADVRIATSPMESNQARATLAFFHAVEEYGRRWPCLPIVRRRRVAVLAYPLSGGFTKRSMVPLALTGPLLTLDRVLEPLLARLCAFRCLVVLERR